MAVSRIGLYVAPVSLTLLLAHYFWRRTKIRHPPSPPSLPLIGNLFSIPPGHEHLTFIKLGEQLESAIIYLEILGHKVLVLNSAETASEVLDKRSALYSDRPPIPMVTDPALMNWSGNVATARYDNIFRHYRRMMNNWLNSRAIAQFHDLQEKQARSLLRPLLNISSHAQPFELVKKEFFFNMGSLMLRLAYGYEPQDPRDPFFTEAQLAAHNVVEAGMQTNFLVNVFPVMSLIPDWLPGTSWKRTAREWGAQQDKAKSGPYEWMKAQIASGSQQVSLLSSLLQDHELLSGLSPVEREERLKEIGIIMFAGGTDTTATFLVNLVFAIVMHPHVQARAQQELDTVLGQGVLPKISDKDRLPYIRGLIDEVFRLYPVLPLALPHACYRDDTYRGYDIQKGTVILGNVWAIGRDARQYNDPDVFNPDRYLDPQVTKPPVFGWGRRKCPGIHFADASTFITTASLLSMFTFSRKRDDNGQEVIPCVELERNSLML
ncbi:unnamed protein product [Rhizoctonia solani]|uniref:O-methylsterigmatocystin oxidoreductase n=1 Tax=Rhizoctonia solani TaxID=456999 RepID=A0A8H2ZZB9_9AGAM|nr:unnamed protein product [Rhizoctonia solani]